MGGLIQQEQPNVVGNFLSALRDQQGMQAQKQQMQLQQQQAARADQLAQQQGVQFQQGQEDRQTAQANQQREQLISALRSVRPGDATGFQKVQQFAINQLGIPADKVMKYTVNDLPALLSSSSQ